MTTTRIWRFAAGLFVLGICAMPAGAATPEDGRRAYDAGRFTDAMGIWAGLSRQGSAQAAYGLGLLYDLGNGTPADPETAFFWYKVAADAGLPAAEFNLGAMYDGGRGVAQSSKKAALWYAKAASHGNHRAQFDIGLLYQQGDGVPRNSDAAVAWLREAADGGVTEAASRLKVMESTPRDRPDGAVSGVTMVAPARNAVVTPADGKATVELVWTAPPEPKPVHYEVQVNELGGSTPRTVLKASLTQTATIVRLSADGAFYVWKVDTVTRDGARVPSDWNWFSVGSKARAVASVP